MSCEFTRQQINKIGKSLLPGTDSVPGLLPCQAAISICSHGPHFPKPLSTGPSLCAEKTNPTGCLPLSDMEEKSWWAIVYSSLVWTCGYVTAHL